MPSSDEDPRSWRLEVPQERIDLYCEIKAEPRALTADEAEQLIELVDAWRAHEHRKHIALMRYFDEHG